MDATNLTGEARRATAIIALKDLAEAKTRLSGLLGASERSALAHAMAEDVLLQLTSHPDIHRTILISDSSAASALAQTFGAEHWTESSLDAFGLNNLFRVACSRLQAEGESRLLILHADVPLVSREDLSAALQKHSACGGVVIGTDRKNEGTNLLVLEANNAPVLHFGKGSRGKHEQAAVETGQTVSVLDLAGVALDIDEPADLEVLLKRLHGMSEVGINAGSAGRTIAMLREAGIAEQLLQSSDSGRGLRPDLMQGLMQGEMLSDEQALQLSGCDDTAALADWSARLRDQAHRNVVTYSRKVFIPLTHLCRDVCHYCTFAQTPKKIENPFMPIDEVLALCHEGAKQGCQEALFTLGERPELRYSTSRRALEELGYSSTLEYVAAVAKRVKEETGLLPHINAGCMDEDEIAMLRPVSASMGIMLESASKRLCEKGMPHYGSPDKDPERRLHTLELAGQADVPFTSGILIGIGETRRERIESLLALRAVHLKYGHLQEVIVQNFRAKPDTLMASAPEPDLNELLWTIAVARLIFGGQMNIQAPPNLSPGVLQQIVAAGINDWGGVSPLTPDHVNPEAPWPHLDRLAAETALAGKFLEQRLTIYPSYVTDGKRWLDHSVLSFVLDQADASGFARRDDWVPGEERSVPSVEKDLLDRNVDEEPVTAELRDILERCASQGELNDSDITRLFESRGPEFTHVVRAADELRKEVVSERVSYVVNRNINYTNVCYFKCQFCAFSKGKHSENLRGKPYDISGEEIARRCSEAWQRGATEVCMQGGIHPDYTGDTYLEIVRTVRESVPDMHIHAFSPLEVFQGAETLGIDVDTFLGRLRDAGLSTLPGTAAEILHDEVREQLCPDKINTKEWFQVIEAAHRQGLRTTATIMYGHIDHPRHWAAHLGGIRRLQQRTGGFTEFVPLPFIHMEAPMYLKGLARRDPTFREAVLMHAVARLVFHGLIRNIQASWVKMGREGVAVCLNAGANDLGGSLMNETITRAAGSEHGQEWSPHDMETKIRSLQREPLMRNTLYGEVSRGRYQAAMNTIPLLDVVNQPAAKKQRSKALVSSGTMLQFPEFPRESELYERVVLMAACD
jgi:FO synthase